MHETIKRLQQATDLTSLGSELCVLITQQVSAFREFVAPQYRPELHYMRGPGPAYARRNNSLAGRSGANPQASL